MFTFLKFICKMNETDTLVLLACVSFKRLGFACLTYCLITYFSLVGAFKRWSSFYLAKSVMAAPFSEALYFVIWVYCLLFT